MVNNLQVIVIAGGSGKRMQPLLTHKSLIPFLGIPMIEHTLKHLHVFQAQKINIIAHPSVFDQTKLIADKYNASVIIQPESLGMADAILQAKTSLNHNGAVLIVDAVTIQEPQVFATMRQAINTSPASILLGGRKVSQYKHGGYFAFNKLNQIIKIIEKPGEDNMPSHYLKLVLDYFPNSQEMIASLENTQSASDDVYEIALSDLIATHDAKMVEVQGVHASLKHAPRVLDVIEVMLSQYLTPVIDPSAQIASNATLTGKVQIGKNVRIFENAVIKGPSYIGDNTIVGNGALIRESCIESDCEIGYNTEVARSYVGPLTKCHTSYIGDSIVEGGSNLAAGTITANLRFDGRNVMVNLPSGRIDSGRRKFGAILAHGVKTGIHASIMPGTVSESDTIIGTEVQYSHDKN